MKKNYIQKISFMSCLLFSLAAGSAFAKPGDIYIGGDVGYGYSGFTDKNEGSETWVSKGMVARAAVGAYLTDNVRGELGFDYLTSSKLHISEDSVSIALDAKIKSYSFLTNVYYDFSNSSSFTPFIGISLGYKMEDYDIKEGKKLSVKGLSYGGVLGIAYKINDSIMLEVSSRGQISPTAKFEVNGKRIDVTSLSGSLNLGLRFVF